MKKPQRIRTPQKELDRVIIHLGTNSDKYQNKTVREITDGVREHLRSIGFVNPTVSESVIRTRCRSLGIEFSKRRANGSSQNDRPKTNSMAICVLFEAFKEQLGLNEEQQLLLDEMYKQANGKSADGSMVADCYSALKSDSQDDSDD